MSDNEHTTVRIVDIARMAGVSVATVDRVIHNRGKVSEENLARINEVLRRVDYRPNLIARSLASGRRYTLCAVMPRFAPGEYWADFEAGIARAEAEAVRYNVTVRRFCFDQYDRSSFESLLETLRRAHPACSAMQTATARHGIPPEPRAEYSSTAAAGQRSHGWHPAAVRNAAN